MTKFPAYTDKEIIKKLRKLGFVFQRQAKGSHEFWVNLETHQRVLIPRHAGKTLSRKTTKGIIKATGKTLEEFVKL
jgi:predicted RNA binding protein YcfA (HicA-like mRNA interferase family)